MDQCHHRISAKLALFINNCKTHLFFGLSCAVNRAFNRPQISQEVFQQINHSRITADRNMVELVLDQSRRPYLRILVGIWDRNCVTDGDPDVGDFGSDDKQQLARFRSIPRGETEFRFVMKLICKKGLAARFGGMFLGIMKR